jgi:RNA polymerase sigma-70 factor, ECF subfamily
VPPLPGSPFGNPVTVTITAGVTDKGREWRGVSEEKTRRTRRNAEHGLVNLEISDAVLAARVQAGDRSAYDELVRRHMRQAFAIAYRIVRNQQDAEDTVQDAFIAALVAIQSFDTGRPFAPWISRIVARKALNALEKRRVRSSDSLTPDLSDGRATPYDDAARAQIEVNVRAALTRLPPRQRTIVELVELEGYSAVEAAGLLGITPATARWHLHEARGTLRTLLAPSFASTPLPPTG